MSITAYAAGVADPENNSTTDSTVIQADLSGTKEVTLYGDASDTTNNSWPAANGSDVTWAWALLERPTGSDAQFKTVNSVSTATSQNPIIEKVDEWGNYRLFLVATNTTTSTTSEADPLKAPDSAFVTIRVPSTLAGIQKPAPGERNWHNELHAWADKIDTNAAAEATHTLAAGNTDIGDATGADLIALTDGGSAVDPANTTNPLHKHRGLDVARAGFSYLANGNDSAFAMSHPGVVYMEDPPEDQSAPTVLTQERIVYTGHANATTSIQEVTMISLPNDGGLSDKEALVTMALTSEYIEKVETKSGNALGPLDVPNWHLAFYIREVCSINNWAIGLQDGGTNDAGIAAYNFELQVAADASALETGTLTTVTSSGLEPKPDLNHGAAVAHSTHLAASLAAGSYVCVVCTRHPPGGVTLGKIFNVLGNDVTFYFGSQHHRGRGLTATLNCIRPIVGV